jgi:flagellar biogenesis protein FliO
MNPWKSSTVDIYSATDESFWWMASSRFKSPFADSQVGDHRRNDCLRHRRQQRKDSGQVRSMDGSRSQQLGIGLGCWLLLAGIVGAEQPVPPANLAFRGGAAAGVTQESSAVLRLAPPTTTPSAIRDRLPGRTSAVRVGSRLAIVLGIFAFVILVQRWLGTARRTDLSSDVIQVCGRVPLNPRQRLLLVRVGERMLVLLESPQGVGRLAEISDPAEVTRLVERTRSESVSAFPSLAGELMTQLGLRENARRA